jgi:Recombinase
VVKAFRAAGLSFPWRHLKGPRKGETDWQPLRHSTVLHVLHNPRYAGAFTYGRHREQLLPGGKRASITVPREEWISFIPGAHPGYITLDQWEANIARLAANAAAHGRDRAAGPPREGPALLQGIIICGRCGGRMTIRYHARGGKDLPTSASATASTTPARPAPPSPATPSTRTPAPSSQLVTDLPGIWNDPATPMRERKCIARLLLTDVTVTRTGDTITAHIRLAGGQARTLPVPEPAWKIRQAKASTIAGVDKLLDHHTCAEIAGILRRRGLPNGEGRQFNPTMVQRVIRTYQLRSRRQRLLDAGLIPLAQMAALLGVSTSTVKIWHHAGVAW